MESDGTNIITFAQEKNILNGLKLFFYFKQWVVIPDFSEKVPKIVVMLELLFLKLVVEHVFMQVPLSL